MRGLMIGAALACALQVGAAYAQTGNPPVASSPWNVRVERDPMNDAVTISAITLGPSGGAFYVSCTKKDGRVGFAIKIATNIYLGEGYSGMLFYRFDNDKPKNVAAGYADNIIVTSRSDDAGRILIGMLKSSVINFRAENSISYYDFTIDATTRETKLALAQVAMCKPLPTTDNGLHLEPFNAEPH